MLRRTPRDEHADADAPTGYRRVLNTIVTHPNDLISLTYQPEAGGEETLEGTAPHPFYSLDAQAFIPMGDLQTGDQIATSDDRVATVLRVTRRSAGGGKSFTTYNFEVEEYHTYFVGEAAIWVHNTGRKRYVELATKLYKNGLSGKTRDELREEIQRAVNRWKLDPKRKAAHLEDAYKELDELIANVPRIPVNKAKVRQLLDGVDVRVGSPQEADALLKHALPNAKKVRGAGPKKPDWSKFKGKHEDGMFHKDYQVDPDTGRICGHSATNPHGDFKHINVKLPDGRMVTIIIDPK